jgi:hypothetical protein
MDIADSLIWRIDMNTKNDEKSGGLRNIKTEIAWWGAEKLICAVFRILVGLTNLQSWNRKRKGLKVYD